MFLATDPAGWHDDNGYLDPGEFDTVAPAVNSFAINSDAASSTTRAVTLDISVSDAGSGMGSAARFPFLEGAAMQFSNDNSNWSRVVPYATTYEWVLSANSGVKTVYARFRDVDGNWSSVANDTITYMP